jgi:flagellar biosynthesis regulator FlaF
MFLWWCLKEPIHTGKNSKEIKELQVSLISKELYILCEPESIQKFQGMNPR